MFLASNLDLRPIVPSLLAKATSIEEASPGLYVLAAREFRYPVRQQKVEVLADQFHRMNLLEKFVLRAIHDLPPPHSTEEIALALGIDPVFIRNTFNYLVSLQAISNDGKRPYVTETGKAALANEKVSEEAIRETWYLVQDAVLNTATFTAWPLDTADEDIEDLRLHLKKNLTQFPLFSFDLASLQPQLQDLGLSLHDPESNRIVISIMPTALPELRLKRIAVFVLYDTLEENPERRVTFQVRVKDERSSQDRYHAPLTEWLLAQLQEQNLSLKTLCGVTDDMIRLEELQQSEESPDEQQVDERVEAIRQQVAQQQRWQRDGQMVAEIETAQQLRDGEIRFAFFEALREAREQIIIYSPWINEQVVDDEFLALLQDQVQQGVRILIGYGIERSEHQAERPVPIELLQRLYAVQTAQGTPGILAEWLGNSHAKEIVIDRKIHFNGSHNWLSYRGDRFPRGETVYRVTIATEVEKAYNHLAHRFMQRAKHLWSSTGDEGRKKALCILSVLEHEEEGVVWIERDKRYQLIPLWLLLAQGAITSGREVLIHEPLRKLISLTYAAVELEYPVRSEIVGELRSTLKMMELKNRALTSALLHDCSPQLKQLGLS